MRPFRFQYPPHRLPEPRSQAPRNAAVGVVGFSLWGRRYTGPKMR